jgi:hypothetical protein
LRKLVVSALERRLRRHAEEPTRGKGSRRSR